jgi:hypothetical protein
MTNSTNPSDLTCFVNWVDVETCSRPQDVDRQQSGEQSNDGEDVKQSQCLEQSLADLLVVSH